MLSEERDELLEETYKLVKSNNKMLKRMRRGALFSFIFKILFWALMIGAPIWFYYQYMEPIMNKFQSTGGQSSQMQSMLQQLLSNDVIKNLSIDKLQKLNQLLNQAQNINK